MLLKMKKSLFKISGICPAALASFLLIGTFSCQKDDSSQKLGGNTNLEENQVGKVSSTVVYVGSQQIGKGKLKVTDHKDGVVTLDFNAAVSNETFKKTDELCKLFFREEYEKRRASIMGENGEIHGTFQFKNTSEGVGFIRDDGKLFVIMRYDVKVGDKWSFTQGCGQKVACEVVHKSQDNDFHWGLMNIKVVKVESTSPGWPGVNKVVYIGNHKFGLIGAELHMEDGSVMDIKKW